MVQEVQEGLGGQQWSDLNHISRMTQRALEVLVAQEVQQDQACHSLVYQEALAAQGGQGDRPLILLWAPRVLIFQGYLKSPGTPPLPFPL